MMEQEPVILCRDCVYCVRYQYGQQQIGECRINPPTINTASGRAMWPCVMIEHVGCGQGKKKKQPE